MPRFDDADLAGDALLLRRVLDKPVEWFRVVDGVLQVSSAAFRDSLDELSVNVEAETTHEAVLENRPDDGLVSIITQLPRDLDHIVAKTLEADDPEDPSHRVICPNAHLSGNQVKKAAKTMSRAAVWITAPGSQRESESVIASGE